MMAYMGVLLVLALSPFMAIEVLIVEIVTYISTGRPSFSRFGRKSRSFAAEARARIAYDRQRKIYEARTDAYVLRRNTDDKHLVLGDNAVARTPWRVGSS